MLSNASGRTVPGSRYHLRSAPRCRARTSFPNCPIRPPRLPASLTQQISNTPWWRAMWWSSIRSACALSILSMAMPGHKPRHPNRRMSIAVVGPPIAKPVKMSPKSAAQIAYSAAAKMAAPTRSCPAAAARRAFTITATPARPAAAHAQIRRHLRRARQPRRHRRDVGRVGRPVSSTTRAICRASNCWSTARRRCCSARICATTIRRSSSI